jgi:HxlR-like helix-turn-helix
MENDGLLERTNFGGNPPRVEYALTERGRLLLPLVEALRKTGHVLGCNECADRKKLLGSYCEACPLSTGYGPSRRQPEAEPVPSLPRRHEQDDSIVLL